ncbi:DNA repair protein endonuclease SAE2/CtIP C-terminus-domain-containing protein [Pholiota molesta]|nr:DNA repair protein endonuclease SAE2/CtIP C-terminus-domain-containing protein [Pholiota molesta]
MAPDKTTYSSISLRERDQQLQAQHQSELNDLKRRHAYVERSLNIKLFETTNHARKLVELLAYSSLDEALHDIESAGLGPGLRDSIQRVQEANARLKLEQVEVQLLQAKLAKSEQDLKALVEKNKAVEQDHRRLKKEHQDLVVKYDKLDDVRRRAGERYKADYMTWKVFYHWLVSDQPDDQHPGVSEAEKKRVAKWKPGVMRKIQDIREGRINISFLDGLSEASPGLRNAPPFGRIEMESDKENDGTPMPPQKKRRISPNSKASASPLPHNTLLRSVTNFTTPSKSPLRIASPTRRPLSSQSRPASISSSATIAPSNITKSTPLSAAHMPDVSETEDESQESSSSTKQPEHSTDSKVLATTPEAGSSKLGVHANLPPRPVFAQLSPRGAKRRQSLAEPMHKDTDESTDNARRRYSTHDVPPKLSEDATSSTRKGKGRQIQDDHVTPLQDKSCVRPDDYSAFKGRGRYGKSNAVTQPALNAIYAIDPNANGGLDYQYDEVVRNRDARRRMHGGDCECCRDYYESVGPLPKRLQQPLWRSPTSSPQRSDRNAGSSSRNKADIESHKKAISRHRHTWARAPTPPNYWDIGFPNTQEATEINKKAAEMHRRKQEEVDREAARGGRYKRK